MLKRLRKYFACQKLQFWYWPHNGQIWSNLSLYSLYKHYTRLWDHPLRRNGALADGWYFFEMLLSSPTASASPLGPNLEHTPPTDRLPTPTWGEGIRNGACWMLSIGSVQHILTKMVVKIPPKSGFLENFKIYFCDSLIMNMHARGFKMWT